MAFVRVGSLETAVVTAIAQDRQGFLWFGTQSNLLRWDGYPLHTYARNPDAPGSLPDNFIRSLLVDGHGQLWVGTNSGGLSRYDPETDGLSAIRLGPGEPATAPYWCCWRIGAGAYGSAPDTVLTT